MLPILAVLLVAAISSSLPDPHSIPVRGNEDETWDGRDPRAVSWCTIPILPSHLGFFMRDSDPKIAVTYTVFAPVSWMSDSVQVTTSTNASYQFRPLVIHNATSYFDGYSQTTYITVSWGDLHPEIYVGLINPQFIGPLKNPLPPNGEYCDVYDVKYGSCANILRDGNKTECKELKK